MGMSRCLHSDQVTQPHCQEVSGQWPWQGTVGARRQERNRASKTWPNHRLQPTPASVRSCLAPAARRG
jgi:hypothetical protein